MPPARFLDHRRECRRLQGRRDASRPLARLRGGQRRQGIRRRRASQANSRTRRARQHPTQGQQEGEAVLLALPLPRPERHRAHVLPLEGLPPHRHSIRPKRSQFPRSCMPGSRRQLLVMSPDPSSKWDNYSYGLNSTPRYFFGSRLVLAILDIFHAVAWPKVDLIVLLRKK